MRPPFVGKSIINNGFRLFSPVPKMVSSRSGCVSRILLEETIRAAEEDAWPPK
jgi:hypothetical protein